MSGEELAAPLGPLPPVKIHCAQLVEGALRTALSGDQKRSQRAGNIFVPTLLENGKPKVRIPKENDKGCPSHRSKHR